MPARRFHTTIRLYLVLVPPIIAVTYVAITSPDAGMWWERAAAWVPLPRSWTPRLSWTTGPSGMELDTQDLTENEVEDRSSSKSSTYSAAWEGVVWAQKSSQGATSEDVREAGREILEKIKEAETGFGTREDEESSQGAASEDAKQVGREILEEVKEAETQFGTRGESTPREVSAVGPVEGEFYECCWDGDGRDRERVERWLAAVESGDKVVWEDGESLYSPNVWAADLDGVD